MALEPLPMGKDAKDDLKSSRITTDEETSAIDFDDSGGAGGVDVSSSQIRSFGERRRHEEHWQRTPNVTGHGAIHVRTFYAKLREDAIQYMDQQINEWLDAHPEYEVKMVSSSVGELRGKTIEDALIVNVWV